jgi:hypothetical protein
MALVVVAYQNKDQEEIEPLLKSPLAPRRLRR